MAPVPSRSLAVHILKRMGESGIPPERGISYVNVGNESCLKVLEEEYLELQLREAHGSTFKLIQGDYGVGKTHFLYCLRDRAWSRKFVTALINLSPNECPFHDPLKVYARVAAEISLAPVSDTDDPVKSFPELVRTFVDEQRERNGDDALREWVRTTLARLPVDRVSFRKAVQQLVLAFLNDREKEADVLEAWFLGHEGVRPSDVKSLGIFEVPTKDIASSLLRSLVQTVRHLNHAGTVLLFDETDKTLSFAGRTRDRDAVLNNLRELIDRCGNSELPATFLAYAVTSDFTNRVMADYPALQQRIGRPLQKMSVRSPKAPLIDLEELDVGPEEVLFAIGQRLLFVYRAAYDGPMSLQEENARLLAQVTAAQELSSAHRRLFVKTWIRFLDDQRTGGAERRLKEEEALRILEKEYREIELETAPDFEDS